VGNINGIKKREKKLCPLTLRRRNVQVRISLDRVYRYLARIVPVPRNLRILYGRIIYVYSFPSLQSERSVWFIYRYWNIMHIIVKYKLYYNIYYVRYMLSARVMLTI